MACPIGVVDTLLPADTVHSIQTLKDIATDKSKSSLDRSQHIANVHVSNRKHAMDEHWYLQHRLAELLDGEEAKGILAALGLKSGKEAAEFAEKNVIGAVAQAWRAMRKNAGTHRGGYILFGVDVLLDEQLQAYVLESNVDPEFSADAVRNPVSKATASSLFQLLAETHAKTVHLFGETANSHAGRDPRGKCFSTEYSPVSANSAAGQEMIKTNVKVWCPPLSFSQPPIATDAYEMSTTNESKHRCL
jgi:hypothetical protein